MMREDPKGAREGNIVGRIIKEMNILWYILILLAIALCVGIAIFISKRWIRINAKKEDVLNSGELLRIMNASPSIDEIDKVVKKVNAKMPISFDARGRIE